MRRTTTVLLVGVVGCLLGAFYLFRSPSPPYPPLEPAPGLRPARSDLYTRCNWHGRPRECVRHVWFEKAVVPHAFYVGNVAIDNVLLEHAPQCSVVHSDRYEPGFERELKPEPGLWSDGSAVIAGTAKAVGRVFGCQQYPLNNRWDEWVMWVDRWVLEQQLKR